MTDRQTIEDAIDARTSRIDSALSSRKLHALSQKDGCNVRSRR